MPFSYRQFLRQVPAQTIREYLVGRGSDVDQAVKEVMYHNWYQEYEADRTGLDLVVFEFIEREEAKAEFAAMSSDEKGWSHNEAVICAIQGCLMFFHFLFWVERWRNVVYSRSSSHPPTVLRIQAIMRVLAEQFQHHRPSLEFIHARINALTECVRYFSQTISKPAVFGQIDEKAFYERRLQDIVFWSLSERNYNDVLCELRRDREVLSCQEGLLSAVSSGCGFNVRWWVHNLRYVTYQATVGETLEMGIAVSVSWNIKRIFPGVAPKIDRYYGDALQICCASSVRSIRARRREQPTNV